MLKRVFTTTAAIAMMTTSTIHTAPVYAQGNSNKDHHDGNKFKNPWPSYTQFSYTALPKLFWTMNLSGTEKKIRPTDLPQKVDINWDLIKKNSDEKLNGDITATWMGHACVLLQLRGFNVLFDPIFSDRCSPIQFGGPKRYTEPPCKLSELPPIDAVVISHNHYDHMDFNTIKQLDTLYPNCKFYVPLGNKKWFSLTNKVDSAGNDRVIELDWWDNVHIVKDKTQEQIRLTCTPAQHQSGRTPFDKDKTLWSSWSVEALDKEGGATHGKVFFGGDTGYRGIPLNTKPESEYNYEYLDTLPHCPAFKEIGDRIGPFDLALIPIGAYSPRWFMSPFHCSPEDAVDVHRDIKSKQSIAIHWGTFVLTDEPVQDPPQRLEAAMKQRGLNADDFGVLPLGGSFTTTAKSTTALL
ncbi:RHO1 GDP-GTP exchange protein 2 [Mucor velutinosus]|uniref:RHO1 GDP-GTP exchange protein 2 n=1 Tax=Mucor velutinosus TaxID=708070 RepID=A0AAN7DCZ8_9FUNG|nr:RHO1 GDP-GTP exchange protein 2 [Mucor velutinosus]